MRQKALLFTGVVVLCLFGPWLWFKITGYAWAEHSKSGWVIVATGWKIVFHGWPLVMVGILFGAVAALTVLPWVIREARDADHKQQVSDLTEQRDQAQDRAEQRLAWREADVAAREQAVIEARHKSEKTLRHAKQQVHKAQTAQQLAVAQTEEAEQRRRGAEGAAERYKRQLAKLRD
ncbi:MAG: hypothetical protein U9Q71_02030 [Pseudomonadota bacterium]|nr:hypothetical protein [Pseudomonadota bacterium]